MSSFMTRLRLISPLNLNICKIHSNAALVENCQNINNRNPRNLELMRIARKPNGYHLEKPGHEFWHRFIITRSAKHVTLEIEHFMNGVVVSASSKEWEIKKRLYRCRDGATYKNLGRILAQRCLESGIMFVQNSIESDKNEKVNLAVTELQNGGVTLIEPTRYVKPAPWDLLRPEKPWEVEEK